MDGAMSQTNGDKARFAKARMKRLRHREAARALRKGVESKQAPKPRIKPD
jgi:hypothetical protein